MNPCALCPRKHNFVPPDFRARVEWHAEYGILFISEAPDKDGDRIGRPLEGKTGKEVNEHYLPLAGLRRDRCDFTNAIKCWPATSGHKLDPNRPADQRLLQSCALSHLHQEIATRAPRLLVPMGAFACMAVDPALHLELHHGIPQPTQWDIPAFPMYHPALGIHSPKKMLEIRTDWMRLKQYLSNTLRVATDDYPEPDYAEVSNIAELDALDVTVPMGCDTEDSPSVGPYFLTYSTAPGTGRLIRASRVDLLSRFQQVIDRWEADILFHHWFYDYRITSKMGIRFPHRVVRDTMVRAYHLGNLPQKLKILAYRELGMDMTDFEDSVLPHSIPRILQYFKDAQLFTWPKPEPELVQDSKTGLWKMYKAQGLNTKLKRFFTDLSKNAEKDVIGMWDKWAPAHAAVTAQLGPYPGVDIAHVPFEQALYYACRDSDATLRLHFLLERMRRAVAQGLPQEKWRDAA